MAQGSGTESGFSAVQHRPELANLIETWQPLSHPQ